MYVILCAIALKRHFTAVVKSDKKSDKMAIAYLVQLSKVWSGSRLKNLTERFIRWIP